MKFINRRTNALFFFLFFSLLTSYVQAHCQIPCGIYDDSARVKTMLEDVLTLEKSVTEMITLAGKSDVQSQNQMVRWVLNKENHAQKIISTISDYFLTQRVKAEQKDYAERLARHHQVIVAAMKVKQGSSLDKVAVLEKSVLALRTYYPVHKHK